MNRRSFNLFLTGAAAVSLTRGAALFQPTWDSVERHTVPDWFQDAKLGIFIHWGLYSVPAWAPPSGELNKIPRDQWFTNNAYAEWYLNSLRIANSPTYKHHIATYGKDFDYYRFTDTFNKETQEWKPQEWASLFKKTGARYVVLTSKHHDGFHLWPSTTVNPHANGRDLSAKRDIVGDLTSAVRGQGLYMGLYYSGGLDWTFTSAPIVLGPDLMARVPQSEEYARYADAQWTELVERYKPSVMWNDISYPRASKIPQLFAHYYNSVPEGVINNRFGVPFSDYTTPEYANYDKITEEKWEVCRGLGYSFGYNQVEGPDQVIHPRELIALFVDIVSKNGNLLLNIGPKPDGTISDIQMDRLHKLGEWMSVNDEAIFASRPWVRFSGKADDGTDIRFTCNHGGLYAIFLNRGGSSSTLRIPAARLHDNTSVEILGASVPASAAQSGDDILIKTDSLPESLALTVKLTPPPQSLI